MSWPTVPLGELMATKAPSLDPAKFPDEDFELWSIPAFDAGAPEMAQGASIGSAKKVVEPNDVLLSRIVPHIRRSWVVTPPSHGKRQIASGEWIIFRSERIYPAYLRHVLLGDPFHAAFMGTVAGVGGSLLRARPEAVKRIEIPLPPLPEQRRIAAILDQADALRRLRRQSLSRLSDLGQAIFLEMFGDLTAEVIKYNRFPLKDLLSEDMRSGAYFPKDNYTDTDGTPMVHMADVFDGIVKPNKLKKVCAPSDISRYILESTDILIARRSINFEGAAKPCRIPALKRPIIFESSLIRIRPSASKATAIFLYYYLSNARVREKFVLPYVTRSTISGINQNGLGQVLVALPPLEQQQVFERRIHETEAVMLDHRRGIDRQDALFTSLQYRAFRGEL